VSRIHICIKDKIREGLEYIYGHLAFGGGRRTGHIKNKIGEGYRIHIYIKNKIRECLEYIDLYKKEQDVSHIEFGKKNLQIILGGMRCPVLHKRGARQQYT
jgi:hypothetical protein